jgi:hypothetical protein
VARAIDVIQRALRIIGVAQSTEALESDVAADALSVFNDLLAEWYGNIAIPDYSISGLTTTLTINDGDKEALAYQLAIRLAPEYGEQISPDIAAVAQESMQRLRNRYFVQGTVDLSELPVANTFSIYSGY